MRQIARLLIAAGLAAALGACSATLHQAETAPPPPSAFAKALHDGYIALARSERDENDFADADYFAARSLSAANGLPPEPERLSRRQLPSAALPALSDARERLTAALAAGADRTTPGPAASAQLAFDCWLQEQEEAIQPGDIAACRSRFTAAIAVLDAKPLAAAPDTGPVPVPAVLTAPVARAGLATKFVIYFNFDSASIEAGSEAELIRAADSARRIGAAMVRVSGHADRAGPEGHNLALSRQRAREVVAALRRVGLADVGVATMAFGEEKPAIRTPNGKREARNRRVEIELTH